MMIRAPIERMAVVVFVTIAGLLVPAPATGAAEWELTGPPGGELREIEIVGETIWVADRSRLHVRRGNAEWRTITVEAEGKIVAEITELEVDPTNPDRLAVSGSVAAFSVDGGTTWHLAHVEHSRQTYVLRGRIAWDPRGDHLYLAANACTLDFAEPSGIYRTSGDLREWTRISGGCVSDVTVDPADPDTIWATQAWVANLVSRDGGATWAPSSQPHPFEIVADPFNPGVRYATGDETQVMRSLDDGFTWQPLPYWLHGPARDVRLAFTSDGTLLAVVPDANIPATLYALVDGWKEVYVPFARATDIATTTGNESIFVTGSLGLVMTEEWPPEWQPVLFEYASRPVVSLATDPVSPERVVASVMVEHDFEGGYVFSSESHAERWSLLALPGLPIPARYQIAIDSFGTLFAIGPFDPPSGKTLLYRLKRGETEWTQLPLTHIRSLVVSAGDAYAILNSVIVPLGPGDPIPAPEGGVTDFTKTKSDGDELFLAIARRELHSSTDRGFSWSLDETVGRARSIEVAPSDPSVVYLISELSLDEDPFSRTVVLRSADGGVTWSEASPLPAGKLAPGTTGDEGLAVHPDDPLTVCVTTVPDRDGNGGRLHCSRDGGLTWTRLDDGFLGGTILEFNATGDWLYAASGAGVQRLRFGTSRRRPVDPLR